MNASKYRNNEKLGLAGETLAANHLISLGYQILGRRYRSKLGEIDLIALRENCIAFVEVKTRRRDDFGDPLEAITSAKLKCIYRASQAFLADWPALAANLEVDFLGVGIIYDEDTPKLEVITLFPD